MRPAYLIYPRDAMRSGRQSLRIASLWEEWRSRPVSRVLYRPSRAAATISLGRPLPGASSSLPGDAAGRLISPYMALHRAGFTRAIGHPTRRALLPHDCTLTDVAAGGVFLWPCP